MDRAGTVGVVHLLRSQPDRPDNEIAVTLRRFEVIQRVAAACDSLPVETLVQFWLVTRPAGTAPPPERPTAPVDAAIWGATRTVATEHARLLVRRISLEHLDTERLAHELLAPEDDDEVILTRSGRFVPRLVNHTPPTSLTEAYRLRLRDRGPSYRLDWVAIDIPEPGARQVVIAVHAAAVNYRDTLRAVGMLPDWMSSDGVLGAALGYECTGVITAVGAEVTQFDVGDRVMVLNGDAFASHVVVEEAMVARLPGSLDPTEAVTMPVALLTAHFGLSHLAQLQRGEVVLVHAAAGGIGLAALQVARHLGAELVATAGTEEKRDFLRLLGVQHVFDSRSVTFAEDVLAVTCGVDVVLNSLAGEAIPRSLELLRPGGRFIELGKRDLYLDRNISLRPFRRNVSFFGMDIDQLLRHRPGAMLAQYMEMIELVHAGVYHPLPHRVFPAARIGEAFRTFQHSRHIGKVVITFDQPPPVERRLVPPNVDSDGTYLVTGGLGGLGGATVRWLADRGARHLALVGRRGADSPEAGEIISGLAARGVTATAYAADVSDEAALRAVLDAVEATGKPLRGVVHAAMVLDDARVVELTEDRFGGVLAPKMGAALLLDKLTCDHDLDLFLMYSSAVALIGNIGQANYCAGNLFLEALVRARRDLGLPGVAVAWGPVSEIGYVARNESTAAMLSRAGLGFVSPREVFEVLNELLSWDQTGMLVLRQNSDILRFFPHLTTPRLNSCRHARDDLPNTADLPAILQETDPEKAEGMLENAVVAMIAATLGVAPDWIDRTRPLDQLGVDSLMGTELVARLRRGLGAEIPVMRVVASGNVRELSRSLITWLKSSSLSER
jgi:NADPH:quinone reductase-like Zn-dependent oxidoreductase/acyl carrier protein